MELTIHCRKASQPKTPAHTQSLNRLILSHFSTLLHLIKSLPSTPSSVARSDEEEAGASGLLLMAVGESTKLLPWVMGARKHVRAYLKVCPSLSSVFERSERLGCVEQWKGADGVKQENEPRMERRGRRESKREKQKD